MKTAFTKIIQLIVLLFFATEVFAIQATPYPISVTQPDGNVLSIYLRGDEFFHYKTTLDGYALVPDSDGILTYAQLDTNCQLKTTNVKAFNIENRTALEKSTISKLTPNLDFTKQLQASSSKRMAVPAAFKTIGLKTYPLSGSPKSIAILVNFSDVSFVTPNTKTAFTNLLNQDGYSTNGGTGSANNYFRDISMGVFSPEFDVVGPFTLPGTMASYGANDASGNDINPQQMVIDACTLAAAAGVDFSQYDTDKNGVVDNVFIYYAGHNEAEGGSANSIWPHRWSLNNYNTKFNGVSIYGYACTSELRSSSGSNMCGIGTFCHEFGHVLGLDDMYATNGATHQTLSSWDIMDYGPYLNSGRTPPSYSSYERFFLDWLTPTELKSAGNYNLDILSTSNKAYLISQAGNHDLTLANDPNSPEYFLLENRQRKGWDTYLPGHGMIITHIYFNASTWLNNTPNNDPNAMGVDIVEADRIPTDATLSGDPFPGTSNVTSFSPTLRSGTVLPKPLSAITETMGQIYFDFMGGNVKIVAPVAEIATDTTYTSFVAKWDPVQYATGYYLTVYSVGNDTSQINYNLTEKWVTNTFDTINNLTPNTVYYYTVKASDKNTNYENITAFSNVISVKTREYPSGVRLQVKVKNGDVTVFLPTLTYNLYIYNTLGQCVKIVTPESTTFEISDLPKHQVYILKSNRLVTKIAL